MRRKNPYEIPGVKYPYTIDETKFNILWRTKCNGFDVTVIEKKVSPEKRKEGLLNIRRDVENYLRSLHRESTTE